MNSNIVISYLKELTSNSVLLKDTEALKSFETQTFYQSFTEWLEKKGQTELLLEFFTETFLHKRSLSELGSFIGTDVFVLRDKQSFEMDIVQEALQKNCIKAVIWPVVQGNSVLFSFKLSPSWKIKEAAPLQTDLGEALKMVNSAKLVNIQGATFPLVIFNRGAFIGVNLEQHQFKRFPDENSANQWIGKSHLKSFSVEISSEQEHIKVSNAKGAVFIFPFGEPTEEQMKKFIKFLFDGTKKLVGRKAGKKVKVTHREGFNVPYGIYFNELARSYVARKINTAGIADPTLSRKSFAITGLSDTEIQTKIDKLVQWQNT